MVDANSVETENVAVSELETKCVMFGGDGAVGKTTAFLYRYTGKKDPEYIPPKVETDYGPEEYTYKETGQKVRIYFDDHEGGGEDWPSLRHLGYERAHVVALCFSVGSTSSFERIQEYWYPFTKKYCSKAKLLLVGTKIDLRKDVEYIERLSQHGDRIVTYKDGLKLARKIQAVGYYECCTIWGEGVKEVFEAAAEATLDSQFNKEKEKCSLI